VNVCHTRKRIHVSYEEEDTCVYVCEAGCVPLPNMHVCMFACLHVCMHVCMYVCMYVHTYYVLINPPIPVYYVLAAVFASCFYVLKSLLHE
jgi:hypothetical protein